MNHPGEVGNYVFMRSQPNYIRKIERIRVMLLYYLLSYVVQAVLQCNILLTNGYKQRWALTT